MGLRKNVNQILAERERNPKYFESISCSKCDSYNKLQRHKYTDAIMCDNCIEEINDELRRAEEEDCEKENYYTDYTYAELVQERNR